MLEIGSASAEMVGRGEVGWCTWRVQTAWLSLGSALETHWLALSGPLLSSYARTGWVNSPLALYGGHFQHGSLYPSVGEWLPLSAMTIASSLMGRCGLSHECVEDGCKSTCVEFGGWKPNRTGDMASLIHVYCIYANTTVAKKKNFKIHFRWIRFIEIPGNEFLPDLL